MLARQSDQSQLAPQNIKQQFSHASICGNNRVVFNIAANKYRLVVQMQYRVGIAWVKFIGRERNARCGLQIDKTKPV